MHRSRPQPRASTSLMVFKKFMIRQADGTLDASGALSRECYETWLKIKQAVDCEAEAAKFYRVLTNHVAGTDGRSPFDPEEEAALLALFRQRTPWSCFAESSPHIGQQYRSRGHHEKLALAASHSTDSIAQNVHELLHKLKPEDASYLTQMASHVVARFGTECTKDSQTAVYDLLRFAVLGRTNRCAVSATATRAQELCDQHPSELTLVFDVTAKTWAESQLAQDLASKSWAFGVDPRELTRLVVAVGGAFHQPGTTFTVHQQSVACKDGSTRRLDLTYVVDVESYYLVVFAS